MSWKSFDVFQSGLQLWIKVSGQEIRQMEAHRKSSHISRKLAGWLAGVHDAHDVRHIWYLAREG